MSRNARQLTNEPSARHAYTHAYARVPLITVDYYIVYEQTTHIIKVLKIHETGIINNDRLTQKQVTYPSKTFYCKNYVPL